MKNLTIYGLNESIACCEAIGLAKCFEAYAEIGEEIMEGGIGFNSNSGNVYIALEIGVTICCAFGRQVEYIVIDPDNGQEYFFDTYQEAELYLENMKKDFSVIY